MDASLGLVDSLRVQADNARAAEEAAATDLGRDEFLKLLVTKLQNQDPLQPTQDEEFVAQLAQFSSLEQLIDLNEQTGSMLAGQSSLINAQAFDLVGRNALVEFDGFLNVTNGRMDDLVYAVTSPAESATLTIRDENNEVVEEIELDPDADGRISLDLSDMDLDLEDGTYTVGASAVTANGTPVDVALFRSVAIDGINFTNGLLQLVSRDRVIDFSSILEVRGDS